MPQPQLLAVVEVDPSQRLLCQAESCGHSIYKRIHIVDLGDRITTVGADCFATLYGDGPLRDAVPRLGAYEGKPLSPEQRELLINRTREFIATLEAAHQERLVEAERLARQTQAAAQTLVTLPLQEPRRVAIHLRFDAWFKSLTDEERHAYALIRIKTEADMRRDMGIDPTLPGFVGMLNVRTRDAFDRRVEDKQRAEEPPSTQAKQPPASQDSLFD